MEIIIYKNLSRSLKLLGIKEREMQDEINQLKIVEKSDEIQYLYKDKKTVLLIIKVKENIIKIKRLKKSDLLFHKAKELL